MKKLWIPLVALLVLFLSTASVSANTAEYYALRFRGRANGACWVTTPPDLDPVMGRGRISIQGSAIVTRDTGVYWAWDFQDPNTDIWTRRTHMKVNWEGNVLMVYMWALNERGLFNDTENLFDIEGLTFSGYYRDSGGIVQMVRGYADVRFNYTGVCFSIAYVELFIEYELFLEIEWFGYEARVWHNVLVSPIGYLPSPI